MSAEHRRPFAAFLLVSAFACAIMANGLASRSSRCFVEAREPRAPLISAVRARHRARPVPARRRRTAAPTAAAAEVQPASEQPDRHRAPRSRLVALDPRPRPPRRTVRAGGHPARARRVGASPPGPRTRPHAAPATPAAAGAAGPGHRRTPRSPRRPPPRASPPRRRTPGPPRDPRTRRRPRQRRRRHSTDGDRSRTTGTGPPATVTARRQRRPGPRRPRRPRRRDQRHTGGDRRP